MSHIRVGGQPNITLPPIACYPIPIPPVREQKEIIRRIEALFVLANSIEQRVQGSTKRVESLTQSILARAFRGELVPTEAELARGEGRE